VAAFAADHDRFVALLRGQWGVSTDREFAAFFDFSTLVFTALRPLDPADSYDLADLSTGPSQVLKVAHRDLSTYPDFDVAEYQ
jgi:hypothetical protein